MPDLMQLMVNERAEALHMYPSAPPVLEVKRRLHPLNGPKLKPTEVDELFHIVTEPDRFSEFESDGMVSFSQRFGDAFVFQVIAFREDGHTRLQIRRVEDGGQVAA